MNPLWFLLLIPAAASILWTILDLVARSKVAKKALIVATEQGVILEAKGEIEAICGWTPADLVAQNITVIIPHAIREKHLAGMEHYRLTGEGPVIGKTLALQALGPDNTLHRIWLTVFGYEKYSEQIYGLVESRQ